MIERLMSVAALLLLPAYLVLVFAVELWFALDWAIDMTRWKARRHFLELVASFQHEERHAKYRTPPRR